MINLALQNIISVVEAVKAVESQRIDIARRYGVTFFSEQDVWLFQEVPDERLCSVCRMAATIEQFRGNNLRMNFPYWEIIDENMIKANVHPNCRCFLVRQIG